MIAPSSVAGGLPLAQAPQIAPHYVSQRTSQAYLREGPSYAYRVLWVYRHKGYALSRERQLTTSGGGSRRRTARWAG